MATQREALLEEFRVANQLVGQLEQAMDDLENLQRQLDGIPQRIKQVRRMKPNYQGKDKVLNHGIRAGLPWFVGVAVLASVVLTFPVGIVGLGQTNTAPILGLIVGAIAAFVIVQRKKVEARPQVQALDAQHSAWQNQQIAALEAEKTDVQQRIGAINGERIPAISRAVGRDCPDIPRECINREAINKLYEIVSTGRADTMKEALHEYDTWKHRSRVEQAQQDQLRLQKWQNMLQVFNIGVNMAGHARTAAAIDRNTDTINEAIHRWDGEAARTVREDRRGK